MELVTGSILTAKNEVFTIGGSILLEKGQKVKVREIEYQGGYWSKLCPDIFIPKKPSMVKLEGITGSWTLQTFEEFNEVRN